MTEDTKNEQGFVFGAAAEQNFQRVTPPKLDFATLVFSFYHMGLAHLGEGPNENGQIQVDLEQAKHFTDIITLLRDKTRGNLTEEEDKLVRTVLYDLRMKFVEKSEGTP